MVEPAPVSQVIVIGGATAARQDVGRAVPLAVVHSIPSFKTAAPGRTHPANAPVMFFFNDRLYANSIAGNVEATANGRPIHGTIVVNGAANGFAILAFTPGTPLPAGTAVTVTARQGLRNAAGKGMVADVAVSFVTSLVSPVVFDNYGFEEGSRGVTFTGDGAVKRAVGSLVPFEGDHYAAISTGSRLLSAGTAVDNRHSMIVLGPIYRPFTSLAFRYKFVSSEFNEHVGSPYDDTALVTVVGPAGSRTEVVTSVNIVGTINRLFASFPGMPDAGDSFAGYTGWRNYGMANLTVGTPAFIIFTVTDVGDDMLSSILAVDWIELLP